MTLLYTVFDLNNIVVNFILFFAYIFQDAHTLDWKEFENVQTNITAIRLLDPNGAALKDVIRDWQLAVENQQHKGIEIASKSVRVSI